MIYGPTQANKGFQLKTKLISPSVVIDVLKTIQIDPPADCMHKLFALVESLLRKKLSESLKVGQVPVITPIIPLNIDEGFGAISLMSFSCLPLVRGIRHVP